MTRAARSSATAALLALVVTLGACTPASDDVPGTSDRVESPAPDPAPTGAGRPTPTTTAVPDVPVRSADVANQNADPVIEPVGLRIAALDVDIPVEPVGVQEDGQMQVPPRAEVGGWYRFGASPADESGTAVVAAHVDSVASAGLGPFARLRDLTGGETVEVALADGRTRAYVVVDVTRVPKPTVAWEDVFVRDGGHRLVLVTCGGNFRPQERSYADNVIVTAEPLPAPS